MNMQKTHQDVGRAGASSLAARRTPAPRGRVEQIETSAPGWRIVGVHKASLESQASTNWRRRLLLARGEQIHSTSVSCTPRYAMAILDTRGLVVSWHDHLPHANSHDHGVVGRHVSQFYLPEDVALYLPARHLSLASAHGADSQRGWRCRPGGEIFWGATLIQTILLSDGELLGYSHVTRWVHAPALHLPTSVRMTQSQTSVAMMA